MKIKNITLALTICIIGGASANAQGIVSPKNAEALQALVEVISNKNADKKPAQTKTTVASKQKKTSNPFAGVYGKEMRMVEFGYSLGEKLAAEQKAAEAKTEKEAAAAATIDASKKKVLDNFIKTSKWHEIVQLVKYGYVKTDIEGLYVLEAVVKANGKGLVSIGTAQVAKAVKANFAKNTQSYKKAEQLDRAINAPRPF